MVRLGHASLLMFGLRLGDDPRVVVTTTPKPIRIIRELIADPTTVITRGSTYDNRFNLPAAFLAQIVKKYEGTHTHGVPARGTGWLCPYGR